MHRYIFLFVLLFPFVLYCQDNNQETRVLDISGENISGRKLEVDFSSTAIVLKSTRDLGRSVPIKIGEDSLGVPLDPDAPQFTYFLSHGKEDSIEILLNTLEGIQILLINSGPVPEIKTSYRTETENACIGSFNSIPQSEWRAGLPAPDYSRSETQVEHVVIHHSAGSNTNTDYIQVVRDIYIYHTEVNGWSDIGYNYLIAQNGTIFNGRDPGNLDQDNVLGAHFCGSNSTTMGICLLGNYETATLPASSNSSLLKVVAWKLDKEGLSPFTKHQHALGNFDAVIGHRDGCSTLCPGENVYTQLDEIKLGVIDLMDCNGTPGFGLSFDVSKQIIDSRSTIVFSNLSEGYDSYKWIFESGIPETATWTESGVVNYNYPGLFDVMLIGFAEGKQDTLKKDGYIEVEGDPIVFPNPIISLNELSIQHNKALLDVELFDLEGREFQISVIENGKYQLPVLKPGIYLLKIQTPQEVVARKLLVE
ncbi:MAG: N-acetylmuramoyl-L-alanine amidase [Bacteroidota bacterium]